MMCGWRQLVALGIAAMLPSCRSPASVASSAELAEFRHLAGTLQSADSLPSSERGRYLKQRVHLRGSSGLATSGWLFRPRRSQGRLPAVLLQDGREENSGVIERLPEDFGDLVVLSLDYPAEMPWKIELSDAVMRRVQLARASQAIPAEFILGGEYLARRADVDSTRIALTATSFAVPFATIAAAADPRFRALALIYGAGNLPGVLAANLDVPSLVRRPAAWAAMRPFAAFAPERFIGLVSPRPVVMVNGIDDPQMPAIYAQQLFDAARPPKSLTWLRTGHLMPTDSALIRTLVDTAFARLPLLGTRRR